MLIISFLRLKLEEQVGEGAFGRVVKGNRHWYKQTERNLWPWLLKC